MNQLTINIAYIADNQDLINKLVNDLKSTGVSFNLIDGSSFVSGENFYTRLAEDGNPCLLMISDNFLKSQLCLNKGLAYLQTLIKNEQVLPLIIDGTEIDAAGNRQLIPTEFEKVSNVIKYMNFWQEKYLDLRKLKRSIPPEEEEVFSEKLKVVRGISSEVGEYLRNLRDTNYFIFSEFAANNYEVFFRLFGDESSYTRFVANSSPSGNIAPFDSSDAIGTTADTGESADLSTTIDSSISPTLFDRPPIVEETVVSIKEPTPEVAAANFLPFDDLITEKEKIDKLSITELAVKPNAMEENSVEHISTIKTTDITSSTTPIEKIEDSMADALIAQDPEWDMTDLEDEEEIDLDEETSLDEIVASKERPLTETEILALELAKKLPTTESNSNINLKEEEEEEEEMISLADLLGENTTDNEVVSDVELMSDIGATDALSVEPIQTISTMDKVEFYMEDNEIVENEVTSESEDEEEDELEGYFVDEGEEEEFEEELSEFDVLQSASTLVSAGKIEDGITLLKETLDEAPDFVSVRYQYAAFLAKFQNNFAAASDQLGLLLDQEPNNLSAKFFLGELAEADRDYLMARNYYEKVHNDNPDFPNVSYKLGMLLVNHLQGDAQKATKYLEEAYHLDGENINALYQFGVLQNESLDNEAAAIAAFDEVLEYAPEHPFANYDLAVIYHERGEKDKALQFYKKAAVVNPELKTAVNDQAFAIAIDRVEAKEQEIVQIVELAESEDQQEDYTISDLVANVHSKQEVKQIMNIAPPIQPVVPNEVGIISEKEVKIQVPKPLSKIVLITGATSGIGKATATKFAKEGFQLILAGRRFSRLFQLKDQFEKEFDANVRLLPFDIKNSSAVQEALAELEEDWQSVDILINNAGLAKGETEIHEGELANWEAMIDTNLKGLLYVTREIAPLMVKRRKGQIINVCSLAGKEVYPNNAVYCATKHAVDALSKAMRVDLHKYNIKVSQVSPGYVEDTEFARVKTGNSEHQITDFIPVNATDVAEVIYFMTTQPSHVTLQEVVMTGTQQASANIIDRSGRN